MTNPQQPVHVTVENNVQNDAGAKHGWQVAAILVAAATIGVAAWRLSLSPYAEMASSGLAILTVTFAKLLWRKKIITAPPKDEAKPDKLAFNKSVIRKMNDELQTAIDSGGALAAFGAAVAYMVGFLAFRAIIAAVLRHFASPWVGGILGGALAVLVMAPWLGGDIIRSMRKKGVLHNNPQHPVAPAPTAPVQPVPAYQPAAPQPAPAYPAQPAPTPAPTPQPGFAAQPPAGGEQTVTLRRKNKEA